MTTRSPPPDWRFPVKTIVVCFSQRSGSNLLCSLMTATGVLGRPEHFFHKTIARRLDPAGFADPMARLQLPNRFGRSDNGVVGFKLSFRDVDEIGRLVDFPRWYPNCTFVHSSRVDLLGQAISFVKALQTGQFRSTRRSDGEPVYDRDAIHTRLRQLAEIDARWRVFFARNAIEPVSVTYEGLVGDVAGTLRRIAGRVGVDPGDQLPVLEAAQLQPQRDATNDAWRERFVAGAADVRRLDPLGADVGGAGPAPSLWARLTGRGR